MKLSGSSSAKQLCALSAAGIQRLPFSTCVVADVHAVQVCQGSLGVSLSMSTSKFGQISL
jgi:hypothetical protein